KRQSRRPWNGTNFPKDCDRTTSRSAMCATGWAFSSAIPGRAFLLCVSGFRLIRRNQLCTAIPGIGIPGRGGIFWVSLARAARSGIDNWHGRRTGMAMLRGTYRGGAAGCFAVLRAAPVALAIVGGGFAETGCTPSGEPGLGAIAGPGQRTVAFESIDG